MVQQVETRLLNEWLALSYPTRKQWKRVRVGPMPFPEQGRLYETTMRWADAIIENGDEILIVEAKMRPEPGAVAQLNLYEQLFPQTPEFTDVQGKSIRKVYLTTEKDAQVEALAAASKVEMAYYFPAWAQDYVKNVLRVGVV